MKKIAKDERGIAVIWVAVSMALIMGAAVLAIDMSAIQTTKTQLQNAADAACLAAVHELLPSGATTSNQREHNATNVAIEVAALNNAFKEHTIGAVEITEADVSFPSAVEVTVRTHRTEATQDPLRTYFIGLIKPFGDNIADVSADATAQLVGAGGTRGFFPWILPDRFQDNDGDGVWDEPEPFDDLNKNGEWDPGEPYADLNNNKKYDVGDFYDPILTGYGTGPPSPFNDAGLELVLKQGTPQDALTAGFFYPTRWPPLDYYTGERPQSGAAAYRNFIINKSPYLVQIGDRVRLEYGNMQGPTKQGTSTIIDECPTSSYNEDTGKIEGHSHDETIYCPRIGAIAFFHPGDVQGSSDKVVTIVKISHWFVSDMRSKNTTTVYGRLLQIVDPDAVTGGGFSGGFVFLTRLVE